ncbi:MAG: hypothetical protein M3N21_02830 [Actinomycetota bacterium]|nr:hypothetical protein [Actinomycetota bacterium]
MSRSRVAAVVVCLAMLTACGSTVQTRAGDAVAGAGLGASVNGLSSSGQGQTTGGGAAAGSATGGGTIGNGPVTGPGGGGSLAAGATGTSGSAGTGASPTSPRTVANGATLTPGAPIQVGFVNTNVGNAANAGLNVGQTYTTDQVFRALVTALNAQGGLNGHRIIPVTADTDTASNDWSSDFQAACAKLTQDNHVAVVVGYVFAHIDSFEGCLAKAGVPHLSGAYTVGDEQTLRSYPGLVGTSALSADRRYRLQLEGAVNEGFVTKQSKVGLLLDQCPEQARAVKNTLEPYMRSAGLHEASRVTFSCANGAGDAGSAASQVQAAVLRFRQAGVDRVFTEGIPLVLFAQSAESQGYRPGYIVTSTSNGAALEPNIPAAQARNVHGYGWMPSVDVDLQHQSPRTASQKRCLTLLASQSIRPAQYNDYLQAFTTCDGLFLYAALLARSAGQTSAAAIARAVAGLGTSYFGVNVYSGRTSLSAGRRDAPTLYRRWAWSDGCSCFTYTGPEQAI